MANTFTKLIKCECGYNYRSIKERGKNKYVCLGYSKKLEGGCTERNVLEEKVLLDLIRIYCNRNKIEMIETNKFMKSIIDSINIDKEHNIEIMYKNGEKSIYTHEEIHI